jgi:hypothetical protein
MKFLDSPSPEELAAEAREALRRRPPMSSRERFTELVRKGWLNSRSQVTKLLCGIAEPEPNYETWTMEDEVSDRENGPPGPERCAEEEQAPSRPAQAVRKRARERKIAPEAGHSTKRLKSR